MAKRVALLLFCFVCAGFVSGVSSDFLFAQILPADRTTVWNPGLHSVGGIPVRTTVFRTLSPSGGDDSAAIQAALDACPAGQVVRLSAGTFTVNDYLLIHSPITLRGSGPSSTILNKTNGAVAGQDHHGEDAQPIVIVGPNRWPTTDDTTSRNLTVNGAKGSLSVTLSSAAGFAAGQFVLLDADEYDAASWTALPNRNGAPTTVKIWASDRAVFMQHNPTEDFIDDPFPDSLTWFSRAGRPVSEVKQILSVSGNVVTFTSPLHIDYPVSKASQLTRYADVHVQNAGVEDLKTTGASDGSIRFEAAAYSWVQDVEISTWYGEGVAINNSFRVEVRDSYIHDAAFPSPGGIAYAVSLAEGSSEALVENNQILKSNKMMVARCAGAGSVVAYNYADDGLIIYDLTWQEVGLNASHMVGSHHVLFEGNEAFNYDSDNTHGNAIYMTVFRNHLTGFRRDYAGLSNGRAAGLNYGSWWHSFVGNVLGVSGGMSGWVYENLGTGSDPSDPFGGPPSIWKLGYQAGEWEQSADPKVLSTVLRGGNYDYLTSSVHWENLTPQTLPNSLYLSAKPSFLGSTPWPPIGPDVSGFVSAIPARACFDQGKMPNCNRVGGSFSPAGLSVDSAAVAGSSSNANGVLEPGETVLVKPSWRNGTASPASATGSASGPDGPAGATYGLPDAAAMYATIAGGSVGDCGSNCYLFSVTNPATRPRQHWDALFTETLSTTTIATESWTLHVGRSFSDVSVSDPAYRFVETLFHRGVTAGCGGTSFCPLGDVTRQQMAVLLLVSKEGQPYSPPACVTPVFGDVPCSSGFARWIDELANRGVTAGCAGGNFCPLAKVTRAQMSVFLLRTLEGSAYTPPACATPSFADVPCSSPFARWIDELNARGVASGCGGGDFCPNANVSRGQMAVFLTVTFGLSL